MICATAGLAAAQTPSSSQPQPSDTQTTSTTASVFRFLGGAAAAFGAHEGGHLLFDVAFDADPGVKRVSFHGVPFFAITHRSDVSPRREFIISSAGFWVQAAGSEWILTRHPDLRHERAAARKGVLAFNVLASVVYAGAAFARTGPPERDTRGMAVSIGWAEPAIGAVILAPALLDAYRYYHPRARWAVWASRAAKVGSVLLVFAG